MSSNTHTKTRATNSSPGILQSLPSTSDACQLDPQLRLVKSLTDKGEYIRALEALSKNSTDPEVLNCRGVCLLRMHEFAKAISPLRMAALNPSTFHLKESVASHIKVNLATALFFGGEPGGGLDTLAEVKNSENDPGALMIHRHTKQWVQQMNLFRRLDWYLNRIAPKNGPVPPLEPIGRFLWDLEKVP